MRTAVAALHAGYWFLYVLLLALLLLIGRLPGRISATLAGQLLLSPLVVLAIVPNVAAFYTSYLALSQRFLARRRIGALVVGGVVVCLATALFGLLLLYLIYGGTQPVFASLRETASLVWLLSVLAAIHVTIALVMRGFADWLDLLRQTHEMELALVRSRLDPHFLFNTLNTLDALIAKDPATASAYLHRLSEIMRFVLFDTKDERIPLARELEYIDRYIALERLRSRHAGYVTHDVIGRPSGVTIAPMTLIPFIENAFKHSNGRRDEGAIRTRVTIEQRHITFECVNCCDPAAAAQQPGGIGHQLIRQRLQLLYPGQHVLDAGRDGDRYRVHLTIETGDDSVHRR